MMTEEGWMKKRERTRRGGEKIRTDGRRDEQVVVLVIHFLSFRKVNAGSVYGYNDDIRGKEKIMK